MHLQEKTITSDVVYKGKIFTVTHDTAELENGQTAVRDVVLHSGGVCVIPVTENNEILMVKQFRYPFAEVTAEIPAGKLEKGESHHDCGKRELLEETGCTCAEYIYMGEIYPTPAYNTEVIHVYLAKGLDFSEQHTDDDEFLDVEKIPLADVKKMVMDGMIKDAKTQIAVLKACVILGI